MQAFVANALVRDANVLSAKVRPMARCKKCGQINSPSLQKHFNSFEEFVAFFFGFVLISNRAVSNISENEGQGFIM